MKRLLIVAGVVVLVLAAAGGSLAVEKRQTAKKPWLSAGSGALALNGCQMIAVWEATPSAPTYAYIVGAVSRYYKLDTAEGAPSDVLDTVFGCGGSHVWLPMPGIGGYVDGCAAVAVRQSGGKTFVDVPNGREFYLTSEDGAFQDTQDQIDESC